MGISLNTLLLIIEHIFLHRHKLTNSINFEIIQQTIQSIFKMLGIGIHNLWDNISFLIVKISAYGILLSRSIWMTTFWYLIANMRIILLLLVVYWLLWLRNMFIMRVAGIWIHIGIHIWMHIIFIFSSRIFLYLLLLLWAFPFFC